MSDIESSHSELVAANEHEMSDSEAPHTEQPSGAEVTTSEQPPIVTPAPTPAAPKPIRGAAAAAAERKLKAEAERKEELKALIKEALAGFQPTPTEKPKKKRSAPESKEVEPPRVTKKAKKTENPPASSAAPKKVAGVPAKAHRQAGPTSKKQLISGPKKTHGAGQTGAKKAVVAKNGKKATAPIPVPTKKVSAAKTATASTVGVKSKPIATAYSQPTAAPTRLNGMYSQIFAR